MENHEKNPPEYMKSTYILQAFVTQIVLESLDMETHSRKGVNVTLKLTLCIY